MPKNYKDGTPHKKTTGCPVQGCDYRARKSGVNLHIREVHGYDGAADYWKQFYGIQRDKKEILR